MSRPMSRNAKIAGVAVIAGIMFAVVVERFREPFDLPLEAVLPLLDEGESRELLARELERCATLTMPDKDCETAWAEKRRRFFGRGAATPVPESSGDSVDRVTATIEAPAPGDAIPASFSDGAAVDHDGAGRAGSTAP